MPRLRFVHAADLHLDSPFTGLRAVAPGEVSGALRSATFEVYDRIVDLCIEERVDALLVAGDVYDGADRSLRAQLKFVDGLRRLDEAGIRSFICHGNHDPLDGWEARLDLPAGCVRFGSQVTGEPVFPSDPGRATVYGMSYPQPGGAREPVSLASVTCPAAVSASGCFTPTSAATPTTTPMRRAASQILRTRASTTGPLGTCTRVPCFGAQEPGDSLSGQPTGSTSQRAGSARRVPGRGRRVRRRRAGVPCCGRGALGAPRAGHRWAGGRTACD